MRPEVRPEMRVPGNKLQNANRRDRMLSWFFLTAALLTGTTAGPPTPADRTTRLMRFGEVDLEVHAPAWAAGESLHTIAETLQHGDRTQARSMLARVIDEWHGELILTHAERAQATRTVARDDRPSRVPAPRTLTDPWLRIAPSSETLATWFGTLPQEARDDLAPPRDFVPRRRPVDVDPELWFPPAAHHAVRRRALALESGDIHTAWLLDRSPNLRRQPTLERWLRSERTTAPSAGALLGTYPVRRHERSNPPPMTGLYLLSRHPLELDPNPDRFNPRNRERPEHSKRRSPLGAIFPLVDADHVVIATGSEAFSVSTSRPHQVEWSIDAGVIGSKRSQPALLLPPVFMTASDRYRVFLFRTDRDEANQHPATPFIAQRRGIELVAFHRLVVFDAKSTPPRLLLDTGELLGKTDSACGRPIIDGDRLYVPIFRGLRRVELEIVAFDLATRYRLWTRHLAGRSTRWIARHHLRGLLPEVELMLYGGELLVSTSFGFATRVDTRNGHVRGVQFFPQFDEFEHRVKNKGGGTSLATLAGMPFPNLCAPRPRYPGPGLVIERPQGPLWVTLPPGSMFLLALDLRTWRLEWKVPVEAQTSLLGLVGDSIALLDTGIDVGTNRLSYRTIDLDGRHARFADLELSVKQCQVQTGEIDSEGPLLVGMPRLFGKQLWIPTLNALEIFDVGSVAVRETHREADRVVPWPTGATGGTPYPIPGGKVVTVGRGDPALGRLGYLEIFSVE